MGTVVVGVDNSEQSIAALRVAAAEARRRGARLRVVHVWLMPVFESVPDPFLVEWSGPVDPDPEGTIDALRQGAQAVLERATTQADTELAGLEVEKIVVEGRPEQALVDAAAGADLLVIGSHGHGRLHDLVLGSVSHYCTQHAPCEVEIVPSGHRRDPAP
jgi:nucleotide-binding universal stress UspA family protein